MVWEFIVPGVPLSVNASGNNKKRWIETVRSCATKDLPQDEFPIHSDVAVSVIFFHVDASPDVDNILKRILDGMHPELLGDDGQVQDVSASRRDISGNLILRNPSEIILPHIVKGEPFVYVSVSEAMNQEDLPWIGIAR
ncbi:RusA family crossover junction endodeoxyribonuclease [Kitasatospora purpeofusca]|uniref:RusA family crossover junction endodeoxyribonuclease n=1 Tax=Kitasatospora purpeofusca TaxID=67352 RepID=UPI00386DA2BE|nr:RusA family crossover junction endodeoxyribonuclease [Kitasatospora purpeofusca]